VAHVHITTEGNGFRNDLPRPTTYNLIALGDSFTRASGVATPWPKALARFSGMSALNLDEIGLGAHKNSACCGGMELYYPFDAYWNQHGHDLAGQIISQALDTLK
jgi:hypothetical protein